MAQKELNSSDQVTDAEDDMAGEPVAEGDVQPGEDPVAEGNGHAAEGPADVDAPHANGEDGADGDETEPAEDDITPEKFQELSDLYLRALADAENVRRISERERAEAGKYGASRLARDLLPVHDSLNRALATIDDIQREQSPALIEGIELTLRELLSAIGRHGVEIIEPQTGDEFDPKMHQAMYEAPSTDVISGRILNVMVEGFTMHNRLLRPAQVGVSSGLPSQQVKVEKAPAKARKAES